MSNALGAPPKPVSTCDPEGSYDNRASVWEITVSYPDPGATRNLQGKNVMGILRHLKFEYAKLALRRPVGRANIPYTMNLPPSAGVNFREIEIVLNVTYSKRSKIPELYCFLAPWVTINTYMIVRSRSDDALQMSRVSRLVKGPHSCPDLILQTSIVMLWVQINFTRVLSIIRATQGNPIFIFRKVGI